MANSIGSKGSGLVREEWLDCSSLCVEWSHAIVGDARSREGYPYGVGKGGSSCSRCWICVLISRFVSLLHEKILIYEVKNSLFDFKVLISQNVTNTKLEVCYVELQGPTKR